MGAIPDARKYGIIMTDREKIVEIVGTISSLEEQVPWTIGLSTLFEWATWQTQIVLGVSKTEYWKRIVHETLRAAADGATEDEIVRRIDRQQKSEKRQNRASSRVDPVKSSGLIDPYEALRRVRYHSEDYLNREFDIFISLVGDKYLNEFYNRHFWPITSGAWSTHSNSTLLMENTRYYEMQFDNLAYNADARVLVANELKLGGRKNSDQILKHLSMFLELKRLGFVDKGTEFRMLFIGISRDRLGEKEELLQREVDYCLKNSKEWFVRKQEQIMQAADGLELSAMSWEDFVAFNEQYLIDHSSADETLRKLIKGMNTSVLEKIQAN